MKITVTFKNGIVLGLQKKLRENSSREIALRVQNNEQKYKRITETRITKGKSKRNITEGFRNGFRAGLKLDVPTRGQNDIMRRLAAS